MGDLNNNIQVRASGLNGVPHTLSEYQQLVRRYLLRLRHISPLFSRLRILRSSRHEAVDADLVSLDVQVKVALEEKQKAFGDESPLKPQSLSDYGFVTTFYCSSNDDDTLRNDRAELLIRGISSKGDKSGGITLTLPEKCNSREGQAMARNILLVTIETWPFRLGSIRTLEFERAIAEDGDICSGQWLTFFPVDDLTACLPSGVDVEKFFGGSLVTMSQTIPISRNLADVTRGKSVRGVLDDLGLVWHSTYAIHGWPPDEQEWRYEEFISGAPRGRKYRIRCVDFDGYDAQRNVLLYAKLFRRLRRQRKEWGLRGWDGPVVNEARRQVRAANGTQIEWHIGLEEPAERVRTLLADYTDFKENQLRVLYTPVSQVPAR